MMNELKEREADPKYYQNRPMMTMPAIFEKDNSDMSQNTKRTLSVLSHAKSRVVHFEKKRRTLSSVMKESAVPNLNVYLEE